VSGYKAISLGKHVLVEVWAAEEQTESGIFLPQQAREKPQIGVVKSVGPAVTQEIAEGDTVAFSKYAGVELDMPDKKTYCVLSEVDIFCKIVKEE